MTLERLRDEIETYLAQHQVGVLGTSGLAGTWAMPARYRSQGLEVDCLLPHWADVAYHLEQDPNVLLIVRDTKATDLRWLECRGTARLVALPDWAWLLSEGTVKGYVVIRIDLVDEGQGWGAREMLDL